MNTAQLVLDSIEKYGEYTAYQFEGREWSNLEHAAYSARLATEVVMAVSETRKGSSFSITACSRVF